MISEVHNIAGAKKDPQAIATKEKAVEKDPIQYKAEHLIRSGISECKLHENLLNKRLRQNRQVRISMKIVRHFDAPEGFARSI